jgi:hypothetical protein
MRGTTLASSCLHSLWTLIRYLQTEGSYFWSSFCGEWPENLLVMPMGKRAPTVHDRKDCRTQGSIYWAEVSCTENILLSSLTVFFPPLRHTQKKAPIHQFEEGARDLSSSWNILENFCSNYKYERSHFVVWNITSSLWQKLQDSNS